MLLQSVWISLVLQIFFAYYQVPREMHCFANCVVLMQKRFNF